MVVLENMANNKSPGKDGFPVDFIKNILEKKGIGSGINSTFVNPYIYFTSLFVRRGSKKI